MALWDIFRKGPSAKVRRLIAEAHAKSAARPKTARRPKVQETLDRANAKIEKLRNSGARDKHAHGSGAHLKDQNILMAWVAQEDACVDCLAIAAGSPYADLPSWPGMNDTRCGQKCRCTVQADPESWEASLS